MSKIPQHTSNGLEIGRVGNNALLTRLKKSDFYKDSKLPLVLKAQRDPTSQPVFKLCLWLPQQSKG